MSRLSADPSLNLREVLLKVLKQAGVTVTGDWAKCFHAWWTRSPVSSSETRLLSANSTSSRNRTHTCGERMMLHWGVESTFSCVQCSHCSRCLHFLTRNRSTEREQDAYTCWNKPGPPNFYLKSQRSQFWQRTVHFYLWGCKFNYFRQKNKDRNNPAVILYNLLFSQWPPNLCEDLTRCLW